MRAKSISLYPNATRLGRLYAHQRWTSGTATIYDLQLEEAESTARATAYTPYVNEAHPIPTAIRNLDGYGWSAGTARNYIEQDASGKWWYHRWVNRVDLGTLSYAKYSVSQGTLYRTTKPADAYTTTEIIRDIMCARYMTVSASSRSEGTIYDNNNGAWDIIDSNYDDATAFQSCVGCGNAEVIKRQSEHDERTQRENGTCFNGLVYSSRK